MPTENHPLIHLSEQVSDAVKTGERVAVIFDLDSTLFCVSPRTQAILRDLSAQPEFQRDHSETAQALQTVAVRPTDWGIRTVLEREKVKGHPSVWVKIRDFWREHFFANHYLHHDLVYPGAIEYVQHLQGLGAEILYLTGRGQTSMREGTLKMLSQQGFPLVSPDHLIMKPSDVETDEAFKALVLRDLVHQYKPIWFFENEPVIIEHVRIHAPSVNIVYVHSVNSGRKPPPTDLPMIETSYVAGLPPRG